MTRQFGPERTTGANHELLTTQWTHLGGQSRIICAASLRSQPMVLVIAMPNGMIYASRILNFITLW